MTTHAASRLTSKYQITVPAAVREALRLRKGDTVGFEVRDDAVITVHKVFVLDLAFTRALEPLLSEWEADADEEIFSAL